MESPPIDFIGRLQKGHEKAVVLAQAFDYRAHIVAILHDLIVYHTWLRRSKLRACAFRTAPGWRKTAFHGSVGVSVASPRLPPDAEDSEWPASRRCSGTATKRLRTKPSALTVNLP